MPYAPRREGGRGVFRLSGLVLVFLLAGCGSGGVPANGRFGEPATKTPTVTESIAGAATNRAVTATATPTPSSYTVADGDTLWDIAQRFGTTVEALAAANGLTNADDIVSGQVLTLATPTAAPPGTTATTAR
jgi:LysM repeat protein